MTDDELRAVAEATDRVMENRMKPVDRRGQEALSRLDALEERVAETERLLGIEHHELHDVAYDGLASGDDGVAWADFEFDQSVPPNIAKKMVDRGYGRT